MTEEVHVAVSLNEDGYDSNLTTCPKCTYFGLDLNLDGDIATCEICKSKFEIKITLKEME